ncbi:type VII secretion protein EsxI [Mycobacterium nebraskense]|uniref:Type VII secretion protein EsxI n=1 Tax=Mycobacterium nebraskense TaxID=244292 RepID=A0A1X1YQB5_9MYCO|nr:type VII secretion protein EsxI [Mycobacterium nebraskense]ORW13307.1 type VII secretion protein EsxI [Mycobacterium nebraskense]
MAIDHLFGDIDAHGAAIRAQSASLETEHRPSLAMCRLRVPSAGAPVRWHARNLSPGLSRNFQVIYEQANALGQKVQTAGSNMASTDNAVGSGWA